MFKLMSWHKITHCMYAVADQGGREMLDPLPSIYALLNLLLISGLQHSILSNYDPSR